VVTSDIGDSIGAGAISLKNVKQEPPEAVENAEFGRTTYGELSITTQTDGAWIIDVVGSGDGSLFTPGTVPTPQPPPLQELRYWYKPDSSAVAGSTRLVPTAGTVTNGWTASENHRICLSMAAFAPVGGVAHDPEPPTVVNAAATNITSNSARLNGEVTDDGYEDPTVMIYWGESDGGTDPNSGVWDHIELLGTQNSTFFEDIISLSPETTYYFRAYAYNSAGGDWADSTASFATTAVPLAPTVVNAAATNISYNSARLNGEVTDTGGEDPTVKIYWGTSDGGTDPNLGVWDHTELLAAQNSTFFDDISSLSESTTYYFRTYAENSGGSDWADSTASFDTIDTPIIDVKINFQPIGSAVPSGYLVDSGTTYGDRGNGYSYGWDGDNFETRQRTHADQRYATINHMQKSGDDTWEIAVPNGTYDVDVVFGDPDYADQVNHMNVEGVLLNDPDGEDNFDEHFDVRVIVSDGKLTVAPNLSSPNIAVNAKICYLDINSYIAANSAPSWTSDPTDKADAIEDKPYVGSLSGDATDPNVGDVLEYSYVSGPAWLSIAANGDLSGTPTQNEVGGNSWTVSVTDGLSTPVEATVNITVLEIYDGENGLEDLAKISRLWLQTACGYCQGSDLNYDGDVGIDDLRIMAERWLSAP